MLDCPAQEIPTPELWGALWIVRNITRDRKGLIEQIIPQFILSHRLAKEPLRVAANFQNDTMKQVDGSSYDNILRREITTTLRILSSLAGAQLLKDFRTKSLYEAIVRLVLMITYFRNRLIEDQDRLIASNLNIFHQSVFLSIVGLSLSSAIEKAKALCKIAKPDRRFS